MPWFLHGGLDSGANDTKVITALLDMGGYDRRQHVSRSPELQQGLTGLEKC